MLTIPSTMIRTTIFRVKSWLFSFFFFFRDEILPNYMGIIRISPLNKQYNGKEELFFRYSLKVIIFFIPQLMLPFKWREKAS